MNLKDRLGEALYRGSLAKPASYIAEKALLRGLVRGSNIWRATALVIDHRNPTPEDLQTIWDKLPTHFSKNFFLLHIMKTGGTSVKTNIARTINCYDLTARPFEVKFEGLQNLPVSTFEAYSFWPFISGHLHIDFFPSTHLGATVFRESRSRFLSHYRQVQRVRRFPSEELTPNSRGSILKNIPLRVFHENFWFHDCVWQFTKGHPHDFKEFTLTASDEEIIKSCTEGLKRIEFAGWTHEMNQFMTKLSDFLEVTLENERRNTYPESIHDEEFILTNDDIEFIEVITRLERELQSRAAIQGLISPLSSEEADAIFESTAKRLNFRLP